jgi:hypothetical protein
MKIKTTPKQTKSLCTCKKPLNCKKCYEKPCMCPCTKCEQKKSIREETKAIEFVRPTINMINGPHDYYNHGIEKEYIISISDDHTDILTNVCKYIIYNNKCSASYIATQEAIINIVSNNKHEFMNIIYNNLKKYVMKKMKTEITLNMVLTNIQELLEKITRLSKIIKYITKEIDSMDLLTSIGYYIIYTLIFNKKVKKIPTIIIIINELLNPDFPNVNFHKFYEIMNYFELAVKTRNSKKNSIFNIEFSESTFEINVIKTLNKNIVLIDQICKFIHYKILEILYTEDYEKNKNLMYEAMQVLSMSYYITDKARFFIIMRQLTEKRLLEHNKIIFGFELSVVNCMAEQLGWTKELDTIRKMINNIKENKQIINTYHNCELRVTTEKYKSLKINMSKMNPNPINNYIWNKSTNITNLVLPLELEALVKTFNVFYTTTYPDKICTIMPELGFGIIQFSGKNDLIFSLYANTLQLIVMMLFNDYEMLNIKIIADLTNMHEKLVEAVLNSLFKSKILGRNKDMNYKPNNEFTYKSQEYSIIEFFVMPVIEQQVIIKTKDTFTVEEAKKEIIELVKATGQLDDTLVYAKIKAKYNISKTNIEQMKLFKVCVAGLLGAGVLTAFFNEDEDKFLMINESAGIKKSNKKKGKPSKILKNSASKVESSKLESKDDIISDDGSVVSASNKKKIKKSHIDQSEPDVNDSVIVTSDENNSDYDAPEEKNKKKSHIDESEPAIVTSDEDNSDYDAPKGKNKKKSHIDESEPDIVTSDEDNSDYDAPKGKKIMSSSKKSKKMTSEEDYDTDDEKPKKKGKSMTSEEDYYENEEKPKKKGKSMTSEEDYNTDDEKPKKKKELITSDEDYNSEDENPKKKSITNDEDYNSEEDQPKKGKKKLSSGNKKSKKKFSSEDDYSEEEQPTKKLDSDYSEEEEPDVDYNKKIINLSKKIEKELDNDEHDDEAKNALSELLNHVNKKIYEDEDEEKIPIVKTMTKKSNSNDEKESSDMEVAENELDDEDLIDSPNVQDKDED